MWLQQTFESAVLLEQRLVLLHIPRFSVQFDDL